MSNPVQDALAAAAAAADVQTAQPIQQEAVQAAQPLAQINQQAHGVVEYVPAAAALTMDDSAVTAVSGVSNFVKLRDGGLELDGEKFGAAKFNLTIEGSNNGGSYQPCFCMNYQSPTGQVYTKSYDGAVTVSNNPAHNGLPWGQNVALIQQKDAKAYTYTGFELTLELAEDTASVDGKTTIPAGTLFGYTTPYTASKLLKAVWDKALAQGKRGEKVVVELSGEEIKSDKGQYKKLILKEIN